MKKLTSLAAVLGIAALVLTACSLPSISAPNGAPPAAESAPPAAAPVEEPGSSLDTPASAGYTATASAGDGTEFSITFGTVTWDASAVVAAENQFNDAAPAGLQYAIVSITFNNSGSTEVNPGVELFGVTFIDASGTSYSLTDTFAVIPNDLTGSSVPPGAHVTGNAVFLVPTATTAGTFALHYGTDYLFITA